MVYYTTIGKMVYCPYLDMDVSLTGKYRLIGDSFKVEFCYATCSIVENSRKPIYDQNENEKYLQCPKNNHCNLLNKENFNKDVNLKEYGLHL